MPNFFQTKAIRVEQPIGVFYAAAIPAEVLLQVCFADRLKATQSGSSYELDGAQRARVESRIRSIGKFLSTSEAGFPNSIILGANYRIEDGLIEKDDELRWTVSGDADCLDLAIPTANKLAAIIDGQHRIFGFTELNSEKRNMPLLCSVFVDLPKQFQAFLFATINSTQKPVDRSLTYELFGYNVEKEEEIFWSPEKLAVFLARKLNTDPDSPFFQRILVAAENDIVLSRSEARKEQRWMVSMATVVDGILGLISSNPKDDSYVLRPASMSADSPRRSGLARSALKESRRRDTSPLRTLYFEARDKVLYLAIYNFFKSALEITGQTGADASSDSYITKTVGLQALFDILKLMAPEALEEADFTEEYFRSRLEPIGAIDFEDEIFKNASGSGRTFIKKILAHVILGVEAPELAPQIEALTNKGDA